MSSIAFKNKAGKDIYYFNSKDSINENDPMSMQYNDEYYHSLLTEHRYYDAADYLAQYSFPNGKTNTQHLANIEELRDKGRIAEAQLKKIVVREDKDWINFYSSLKGRNLNYTQGDNINKIQNEFLDFYKQLGGYIDNNGDFKEVNKLKVVIPAKKRVGNITGWDWVARDNKLSVNDWVNRIGVTTDELKQAEVKVETLDDGALSLTFDKSNKYAMDILVGTSFKIGDGRLFGYSMPAIYGVGDNNELTSKIGNEETLHDISGLLTDGFYNVLDSLPIFRSQRSIDRNKGALQKMYAIIDKADKKQKKIFKTNGLDKTTFSSISGPMLFDSLYELEEAYNNGSLGLNDYEKLKKDRYNMLDETVKSLVISSYPDVYTNIDNEFGDYTLQYTDKQKLKGKLQNEYNQAMADNRVEFNAFYSNGEYGTLITIYPPKSNKSSSKGAKKDEQKTSTTQIFIPELLTEQAQNMMYTDTKSRAAIQMNNMGEYGSDYVYRDVNGNEYNFDGKDYRVNGNKFSLDNRTINDYGTVFNAIQEDMITSSGLMGLLYEQTNRYGQIIDTTLFKQKIGELAMEGAYDIHGNIPLTDETGMPINPAEVDLFDLYTKSLDDDFVYTYHNDAIANKFISYRNIYTSLLNKFKEYIKQGRYVKPNENN